MDPIDPLAVDVVIPVRDGAHTIGACLDSVRAQTRPVRAVIVVDDGSTDATPAVLEQYRRQWPPLEVVRTEKCGVSHARNVGIARCRAPFVAFLDSDDVWLAGKLERQLALFAGDAGRLGFVYCGCYCIDANGRTVEGSTMIPRLRGNVVRDLLVEGNVIWGSSSAVVARRELLERVGGFDERLWYGEDWDLWLKLAAQAEVAFTPEALACVRLRDKGAPSARSEMRQLLQHLIVVDRWRTADWLPASLRAHYRDRLAGLAYGEIAQRRIAGWLFARTALAELKRSDSAFARDLFAGPVDFFRELSPRIATAIRRRTGFAQIAPPDRRQRATVPIHPAAQPLNAAPVHCAMTRISPGDKISFVEWMASPMGPRPAPFLRKFKLSKKTRLALALRNTFSGEPTHPRRFECLYIPSTPFVKVIALRHHAKKFATRVFVETGTCRGDTIAAVAGLFQRCYTIELSSELHAQSRKRLSVFPHVSCIEGESSAELPWVLQNIDEPALFWLDAHATGGDSTADAGFDPIFKELDAIYRHPVKRHVILIDDARGHDETIWLSVPAHYRATIRNDIIRIVPA